MPRPNDLAVFYPYPWSGHPPTATRTGRWWEYSLPRTTRSRWTCWGVSLARAGRAGEAVPLLEKAAGLDPENPVIRQHLAVAKAQITASSGMPGSLPAGKR